MTFHKSAFASQERRGLRGKRGQREGLTGDGETDGRREGRTGGRMGQKADEWSKRVAEEERGLENERKDRRLPQTRNSDFPPNVARPSVAHFEKALKGDQR